MRRICGVIAEFNPFHNGHAALLRHAGEAGTHAVVAVMSGNFVQRGSPAITDKRIRAKAALLCGADLVLELPLPYATATAQRFARGAVGILQMAGCDTLAFGSECGDVDALRMLAGTVDTPATVGRMRQLLGEGLTFAKARELAVEELLGPEPAALLSAPNNALAIEYLRQAAAIGWKPRVLTLKRVGAEHDSREAAAGFASASYLRGLSGQFEQIYPYVPEQAAAVYAEALAGGLFPADPQKLETAVLAHLRRLSLSELETLPDLSEGLENRLYSAIRTAASLEELEQSLKTKRYTMARVRRLILAAFLGLQRGDCDAPPPYLRVLGFQPGGREVLSAIKGSCPVPVSTSLARLRARGGLCGRFAMLEETATDLYGLCLPKPVPCGYEYSASAVYFK